MKGDGVVSMGVEMPGCFGIRDGGAGIMSDWWVGGKMLWECLILREV
jgi:hypothetical protein